MSYHTVQQRLKICAYNQQPWLQNLCSKHMRTGEHVHGQTVAVAGLGAAPGPVLMVQPIGVCGALSALLLHPCLQSLTWGGGGGALPAPAQPPPSPRRGWESQQCLACDISLGPGAYSHFCEPWRWLARR